MNELRDVKKSGRYPVQKHAVEVVNLTEGVSVQKCFKPFLFVSYLLITKSIEASTTFLNHII